MTQISKEALVLRAKEQALQEYQKLPQTIQDQMTTAPQQLQEAKTLGEVFKVWKIIKQKFRTSSQTLWD